MASTATTIRPAFLAERTADCTPAESVGFSSRMSIFFWIMSSTSPICLATSWRASVVTTVAPMLAAASSRACFMVTK
ncbi:hypothetical protein D9M69_626470 [compost metagenome]